MKARAFTSDRKALLEEASRLPEGVKTPMHILFPDGEDPSDTWIHQILDARFGNEDETQ